MEVGDHYVVTGGKDRDAPDQALNTVARYGPAGFINYLAPLNQRRYLHACSRFLNEDDQQVRFLFWNINTSSLWPSCRSCLSLAEHTDQEEHGPGWTVQSCLLWAPPSGELSRQENFPHRDLASKLPLYWTPSTFLVRTDSMFYNILHFILLFYRRIWRIISQHHPHLQWSSKQMGDFWTNEREEILPRCRGDGRLRALPLMMKTIWKIQKKWVRMYIVLSFASI